MRIDEARYEKIKHILPTQRGNVTLGNMQFINALLYICENGCKWRRLPQGYGHWNAVYKRFRRWVEVGIIDKLFQELHVQNILKVAPDALFMDSKIIPVHPDACGALKKVVNRLSDGLGVD
jgi:transposase